MNPNAAALIVAIVRHIAQAAPRAVPPQDFAILSNLPREDVTCCVVYLCMSGVLQEGNPGGAGSLTFTLTTPGEQLLRKAGALEDFAAAAAADLPVMDGSGNPEQRRVVRQLMLTPSRPHLMRLVLLANIAVFVWGWVLAGQKKVASEFFNPIQIQRGALVQAQNPGVQEALIATGLLRRTDLADGQWWRLLSCCFVQFGIFHLVMNLYALWVLGRDVEWLWGPVRFALIYLLACFAGSCAAMTTASAVAGASGAICGLFGAVVAWLLLNRHFLPPRLVRVQLRGLIITGLLVAAISLAPGVSGMGHLGGALAGAAAALLLHFHRYGGRIVQVVCIVGLLIFAGALLLLVRDLTEEQRTIERQARETAEWKQMDGVRRHLKSLHESARIEYASQFRRLTQLLPRDRTEEQRAFYYLERARQAFREAIERIDNLEPFSVERLEMERVTALEYFGSRDRLIELIERGLRRRVAWDATGVEDALAVLQKMWIDAVLASEAADPLRRR